VKILKLFLLLTIIPVFLLFSNPVFASSSPSQEYSKAEVVEVVNQGKVISGGITNLFQDLRIKIDSGSENGKFIALHIGDPDTLKASQEVKAGDQIVLLKAQDPSGKTIYSIYDRYRLNNIALIVAFFFILIFAVSWLKGFGSILGLATSLGVILFFIIPRILAGNDPLLISIIGALVILFVTTYVAHGVSRQTTVALASTFISLFITAFLATSFSNFSRLEGLGNEDILSLQVGATSIINLKGLFLGGIIIGALGALNDVTVTQAATVFEIAKTDKTLKFLDLAKKGFLIGREHILSLVNTLVLAYAGSSLFIFIFLVLNPGKVPYWVIINTETISDEIVSTIVGSSGLILAVPIATILAAWTALTLKDKIIANKKIN